MMTCYSCKNECPEDELSECSICRERTCERKDCLANCACEEKKRRAVDEDAKADPKLNVMRAYYVQYAFADKYASEHKSSIWPIFVFAHC